MGNVIQLFPSNAPAGDQRMQSYFDMTNWRVSRKGNAYLRTPDGTVTIFGQWNNFRWAIARSAREKVQYSERLFDSEDEARRDAWAALEGLTERRA